MLGSTFDKAVSLDLLDKYLAARGKVLYCPQEPGTWVQSGPAHDVWRGDCHVMIAKNTLNEYACACQADSL